MTTEPDLPFEASAEDEVAPTVVDLGVARALWEGVPSARLLARVRLHLDERDLVDVDLRASGVDFDDASWDIILARLLAGAPGALDRVKRAVARHARAATDEGPLPAGDAALAALVHAHLSATDADASPAEGANDSVPVDELARLACARFDDRLAGDAGARRGAYFEACLELAKRTAAPAWPLDALRAACGGLAAVQNAKTQESGTFPAAGALPRVLQASSIALYPWPPDGDVPISARRTCAIDRALLERVLLRPERELSGAVARASGYLPGVPIAKIVADLASCLARHGTLLLVVTHEPRSYREPPRLPPESWAPVDLGSGESAASLASALERGALTAPRARTLLMRGGDSALDAIGKEMLDVAAHPFASAAFAEILAPFARERDVVRLVTYFAIAPDPRPAARALDLCNARDVVARVLRGWLETMLPAEGVATASERLVSCVAALRPHPALYAAVEPLLTRLVLPGT